MRPGRAAISERERNRRALAQPNEREVHDSSRLQTLREKWRGDALITAATSVRRRIVVGFSSTPRVSARPDVGSGLA